jgi:ribonuclease P protein component
VRAGGLTLRFVSDGSDGPARVAYAIGRQVGSAVVRNRIRRRLRAAVAQREADLAAGGVYLIGADRTAMSTPFENLTDQLARLLRQVGGGAREH